MIASRLSIFAVNWASRSLLTLSLAACSEASAPPAVSEPLPEAVPESRGGECRLLPERPPDLAIRLHRSIVPHGEMPRSEGALLRENCAEEPDPLCRETPAAVMDDLYRRFLDEGFARLGQVSEGGAASPHYGSRSLTLAWSGGQQICTVMDASHRTLPEAERQIFSALFQAVLDAFIPLPPPK